VTYTAEIIAVGTELLLGGTANTDAQDVSRVLSELGINVFFHTVVGDNPERMKQAVEIAKGRADIIITTGGLGPTFDDVTKQTLAEAFGKKLVFNEEVANKIKAFFKESSDFIGYFLIKYEFLSERFRQRLFCHIIKCRSESACRYNNVLSFLRYFNRLFHTLQIIADDRVKKDV